MSERKPIPLEGVDNARDLGGFETADGYVIRRRRLIRSSKLSDVTGNDERILVGDYDLRKVIDFRASVEKRQSPDVRIPGTEYIELPVFEELISGITHEKRASVLPEGKDGLASLHPDQMKKAYRRMVEDEYSRNQYRKFFDVLLDNEEGAVLWHCTMGKDRAGLATVLLLSALGVSKEDILSDYVMTNTYCAGRVDRIVAEVLSRTEGLLDPVTCREFFSAKPEYIDEALSIIDENFGSVGEFLSAEMGLSAPRLIKLRDMYLA